MSEPTCTCVAPSPAHQARCPLHGRKRAAAPLSEPTVIITAECPVCDVEVLSYGSEGPRRYADGRPGLVWLRGIGPALTPVKYRGYSPTLLVIHPCGHRLANWLLYGNANRVWKIEGEKYREGEEYPEAKDVANS